MVVLVGLRCGKRMNGGMVLSDDIVDRLRNEQSLRVLSGLCDEAADEIERLAFERDQHRDAANAYRAEVERLRAAGDALAAAYRTLGGLEVAHNTPLRAWQEARRG